MFDLVGLASLAAFAGVLWTARAELSRVREEASLHVDAEALAAGFREGVAWHGLYRDDVKIGFSRVERRRQGDGYVLSHTLVLPAALGDGLQTIAIDSRLDSAFVLVEFTARVDGGPIPVRASGRVDGERLHVDIDGLPGGPQDAVVTLSEPPRLDQSLLPIATRPDVQPGDRFSFTHVDPLTGGTAPSVIEVVGHEPLDVLGEEVTALHLRQSLSGTTLDLWVNPLGEILRQTLPGGLVAVRESEAEATWGVRGSAEGEP